MGEKGLLDGKELEGKIGEVGSYSVDVDSKLNVKIEAIVSTVQGGVTIESRNSVEAPLMEIIKKACLKNNVSWDEKTIAGIELLLGLSS